MFNRYKKNPKNLSIAKVGENIPTAFLMSSILSFKNIKKHWFGESFRQYAMDIIKFKKKKNEITNKRAAGII